MYKKSVYSKIFQINNNNYLFNSFSRACIKINNSELDRIKKILEIRMPLNKEGKDKIFQNCLLDNGFIIDSNIDELKHLEYMFNNNYFNNQDLNIVLVPTLDCNFKCPYCFEKGHQNNNTYLNDDYFEILKKFSRNYFHKKRKIRISLFGGEPLLKIDKICDYLEFIYNNKLFDNTNISTSMTTNGYLLNNNIMQKLLKYNFSTIQVTLDGNKESHDKQRILKNNGETFNKIVSNLKDILKLKKTENSNFKVNLRINLLNQNIKDLEDVLTLFTPEERKEVNILLRPIYNTDFFDEQNNNTIFDLKKYLDKVEEHGYKIIKSSYYLSHCESGGGTNFIHITPDLKLWKCLNDLSNDKPCIGKINIHGELVLNNQKLSNWYYYANPFTSAKCRVCYYLPVCYGGCLLHYLKTGKRKCNPPDMTITPYIYR